MRTRGLIIALSVCLPLVAASCNLYFDEGAGSSNHKHPRGPDAGPAPTPDGFPGGDVDAAWGGWPDAAWGVPPDAAPDAGFQEPDAGFQLPDAAPDASTCPTPDAAPPDAHACGC